MNARIDRLVLAELSRIAERIPERVGIEQRIDKTIAVAALQVLRIDQFSGYVGEAGPGCKVFAHKRL